MRLAARVPLTSRVRLLEAAGLAHQAPGFLLPVPGVAIGGLAGGLQRSVQTSLGVEADLPLAITASATLFYDAFFNLSDPAGVMVGTTHAAGLADLSWLDQRAQGSGAGLEIYLRRKLTERLGGYVAYTLSRSSRQVDGMSFAALFDRTHVLGSALSWDIGRGFRVGARGTLYTGSPVSPYYPADFVAAYGHSRLPPFFRLDVRAEKRWIIASRGWIALVLEAQNVTLAKEAEGLVCTTSSTARPTGCAPSEVGPITLPSLGLEGGL